MPWPVPAPGVISARAAAVFEQLLPGIDARSDNTVATTITRVTELAAQDLYYEQGYFAAQLMPDTATDWLPRHGAIWGVPQAAATLAAGNAVFAGAPNADIPIGVQLKANSGVIYQTTQSATIPASGTVSVPVVAGIVGTGGNLPAGTTLTIVSPVAEVSPQTAIVDTSGITGGLALEGLEPWRARILQQIRFEPSGGDYDDYVKWATATIPGVAFAACPPGACGGGVVSVVFAMAGPTAPTAEEIAAVQAYIDALQPVTATVTVYGAVLNPIDVSLQVRPNTVDIQAAAQQALTLFFAQSGAIGGTTYLSQVNAALSAGDGETYHELLSPTADVAAPSLFALNTLGSVVFS